MQEVKTHDLMKSCIQYFKDNCYTENRITKYKSLWRTGIVRYMSEHGVCDYSPSVRVDFILTCHYNGTVRQRSVKRFVVFKFLTIC